MLGTVIMGVINTLAVLSAIAIICWKLNANLVIEIIVADIRNDFGFGPNAFGIERDLVTFRNYCKMKIRWATKVLIIYITLATIIDIIVFMA